MFGGPGSDYLSDNDGASLLDGGDGPDSLSSGPGNETLWGGSGRDNVSYVMRLSDHGASSHCHDIVGTSTGEPPTAMASAPTRWMGSSTCGPAAATTS